jgi:hypothetical protein
MAMVATTEAATTARWVACPSQTDSRPNRKAAFVGPPPTDIPIYVLTETMTVEEWIESCRRGMDDPAWAETHGGSLSVFRGMESAKRIHVADRPVRC